MKDTLKPCPFCGGNHVQFIDMVSYYCVGCDDCGADGPTAEPGDRDARNFCIEAWNTRAGEGTGE